MPGLGLLPALVCLSDPGNIHIAYCPPQPTSLARLDADRKLGARIPPFRFAGR